jgi:hypothetical protein
VIAGLLLMSLGSCSYTAFVDAAFVNGRLGFVLRPGQRDQGTHCLFRLVVSSETGETVWEILRRHSKLDGCGPWLPQIYGRASPDLETLVPMQRLRMEVAYVLHAEALDGIDGAFVLHRRGARISVENLDWNSERVANAEAAARSWQDARADRARENAQRPQNEIFEGPFQDRPLPAEQH